MGTKWQDKNVGVSLKKGTAKTTRVRDERDGSHAGLQIEHWDDRMDAVVRPKPIEVVAAPRPLGEE